MKRTESDRYVICKQVSYHLGNDLDPATIWEEVLTIRPAIDPGQKAFLDHCVVSCRKRQWEAATEYDLRVISRKHSLVGMIDRVLPDYGFSIVRSSGVLPFGIAGADRLRITAYALCLEEMTHEAVNGGSVEYIAEGISRSHEIQPRDRRHLVSVLRKVSAIRDGNVPERPLNAPCGRCQYRETCETSGGRRLSELL